VDSIRTASETIQYQKRTAAQLVEAVGSMSEAANLSAAGGESVNLEFEKQRKAISQMEEMSRELDGISEGMKDMLKRFGI
jgi:methyl-accepting chemotaxis protein